MRLKDRKELVKFVKGERNLDIGTGDAYPFNGKLPDNFIGIDINPKVERTIKADVLQGLPFPDKTFDCVTAFELFEHIPPEKRDFLVKEIKRVCKHRVIISVPDKNDTRNFPDKITEWQPHPHVLHPDWLFDEKSVKELADKFGKNYKIFIIENRFYKGYGVVIDL